MFNTRAYSAVDATSPMAPTTIARREPSERDVQIEILYCGICHTDLHQLRNDWNSTVYPIVPGHEIVGRVSKVGSLVTRFKSGDRVAVGCLVDSDGTCEECLEGHEQFCQNQTMVFGAPDKRSGGITYGGFSESIVVDERFVLRVPDSLEPAAAAPLLCAGITTYSPLRHWDVRKGKKVGIVGLGGLGHLGVKFAHAFGAHVVVVTTSAKKTEDAKRLGADEVVVSSDADAMRKHAGSLHFILDTVSGEHDVNALVGLLRRDGNLTLVGAPPKPIQLAAFGLIFGRHSVSGSNIGGIKETQEMLDFCGKNDLTADIELIRIQEINAALDRLQRADVKYRFVIDMKSIKQ